MKKVLFATVITLSVSFFTLESFASSVDDYMNYLQKLSNCTPSEYSLGGTYMKIYGLTNGICHFTKNSAVGETVTNMKTKETISVKNCDFRLPLSTTKSYADISTKITKSFYGKSEVTQTELEKDMSFIFNLQKRYCK